MDKNQQLIPIYEGVCHRDFREMLNYIADEYKDLDAFIIKHKVKKEVTYEHIKFDAFRDHVNQLGTGLLKRGLKGKHIAIMSKNRYEWVVAYFATLCGIGKSVPLDKGLPFDETESSLVRSYADVFIFDPAHADIVAKLKENNLTKITEFICMEEMDGYLSLPQIIAEGKAAMEAGYTEYLEQEIDPKVSDIILFTSGTTSTSKAVLLSQYNILSNLYAMLLTEEFYPGDVNMAFLPYHHTFGSTGQIVMLASGITTTFCDGLKYLQKNIVEYKVSVFVCVPLLIESIYKKIMQSVAKQGKEGKVKFGLALSKFLLKFGIDIRRKLFKEILDQLGGNLRYVISGASAIDPEAIEGFKNFGITAVQGYGMTEASPVIAAENPQFMRLGSIGKALPGIEVRIDEPNEEGVGELIARGPNVMEGYFENPEETAKVIQDGWLHTGDLAYRDSDGFLFIRGRKKNVIVLKNGKNVYPEELEILVANLPYVEENMVFGQKKHKDGDHKDLSICVKIVYNPEYMKEQFNATDPDEIESIIKKDIDVINESLPAYKQMLRVIVTDEEMIKTTTGKVKRYQEEKNL
ncbi:long-chain acyl-CoA synthetase [Clostridiales Family XIII bacterium PM5-7]